MSWQYIYGGLCEDPIATEAVLAAWDPATRTKLWETTPVPDAETIVGLVSVDDYVYGLTGDGTFFVVDPSDQSTIHRKDVASTGGELATYRGMIYAAPRDKLVQIDPASFEISDLHTGLNHWQEVAVSNQGYVYIIGTTVSILRERISAT